MSEFMAELIGTMILIYLGDSVVAAVSLKNTKTEAVGGSWLLVAFGWGLALTMAIYAVGEFSGAHLNPAVTLAFAAIGTFVLVLGILFVGAHQFQDGWNPLIIGLLLFTIGMTIGSTTGFSINPARDLAPRIAHAILPIPGKGDSDWGYSMIPVIGPLIGGIYGASFYTAIFEGKYETLFWIFSVIIAIFAIAAVSSVLSKEKEA